MFAQPVHRTGFLYIPVCMTLDVRFAHCIFKCITIGTEVMFIFICLRLQNAVQYRLGQQTNTSCAVYKATISSK